ncbi:MAG: hypothetical protein AUJ98_06080 [Bacteroidetes bacterium CG2_30_33_31]|nr:MAG: hypothetical protein AUJ98_06080 [Bacteroidetes bacterium CG2_30_33_31]
MRLITISKIDRWSKSNNLEKLVESLKDERDEIRKAAALSLGHIGDSSVLDVLIYALDNDPNAFVKKDIEKAINSIKTKYPILIGKNIFNENIESLNIQTAYSVNVKYGS